MFIWEEGARMKIPKFISFLILLAILSVFFLGSSMLFLGCKTFEPIWLDELPAECNMSLNAYRMYYQSADKSAVMPSTDFCFKKIHRLFCQEEVFGYKPDGKTLNPVDYQNPVLYRNYEQCRSELK